MPRAVEQRGAAVLKQQVSQPAAERGAIGDRTARLGPDHRGAVRGGDETGQAHRRFGSGLCDQLGQGADRCAATDVERGQEAPFGDRRCPGRSVVEGPELDRRDRVVGAALDGQHALRWGGHEQQWVKGRGDFVEQAEPR